MIGVDIVVGGVPVAAGETPAPNAHVGVPGGRDPPPPALPLGVIDAAMLARRGCPSLDASAANDGRRELALEESRDGGEPGWPPATLSAERGRDERNMRAAGDVREPPGSSLAARAEDACDVDAG